MCLLALAGYARGGAIRVIHETAGLYPLSCDGRVWDEFKSNASYAVWLLKPIREYSVMVLPKLIKVRNTSDRERQKLISPAFASHSLLLGDPNGPMPYNTAWPGEYYSSKVSWRTHRCKIFFPISHSVHVLSDHQVNTCKHPLCWIVPKVSDQYIALSVNSAVLVDGQRSRLQTTTVAVQTNPWSRLAPYLLKLSAGMRQGLTHVIGLFIHGQSLPYHSLVLSMCKPQNTQGSKGGNKGTPNHPPIGRRVVVLFGSLALYFPSCYFSSKFIDRGYKKVGVAIIWGCFGLLACALALMVLNGFTWTWGWRL